MSTISPKTDALVSLRYVVMSFLNRKGIYDLKNYKRHIQIVIEGMTELNLTTLVGVEVIYTHMSLAKTVALPSDFIKESKIGIPVNGKLRVLTNKEEILFPRTFDDDSTPVGNTDSGDDEGNTDILFFANHFRNGQFTAGLYGLSGGIDDCYYRIDWESRQIVFSGETPRSEIVLEYFSSGLKESGGSLVPRQSVAALRSYLDWVTTENDSRAAYNEKERKKRIWEEEESALRHFELSFTADEFLRTLYSTYRQSIKR